MIAQEPEHNPAVIAAVLQRQLYVKFQQDAPPIAPVFSGPQVDTYKVELTERVRVEDIERISRTLGIHAGSNSATVSVTPAGEVLLHIARPEHARSILYADAVERVLRQGYGEPMAPTPLSVCLGLDMVGKGVWLNLTDPDFAHILLAGVTGSGKSILFKWFWHRLLLQNQPEALRWIGADPKKNDPKEGLFFFRRSAHLLHPIVDTTFDVLRLLEWVLTEIDRRKATRERDPRIVVVLEEVSYFADESPRVLDLLDSIMRIARGFNITVIATTQKPGVEALGKALNNFTFTVSGRVARGNSASGSTGRARTGADRLLGKGDVVALYPGDVTVRFQAPFATPEQFRRIPKIEKGQPLPRLALDDVTQVVNAQLAQRRGGTPLRQFTAQERQEAARLLGAGRGIDAVRRALNCGTDQAKRLAADLLTQAQAKERVYAREAQDGGRGA